jgi:N-acyl-L-homoserine lactone synthetase
VIDADPLARIDAIARLLIERNSPVTFRVAIHPSEVAAAQRLRGQAMVDQGWAHERDLSEGRDEDADDQRATHVLATLGDQLIGTCRLVYPEEGRLLPMEADSGHRLPEPAAEVGRVVVIDPDGRRHRSVTAGLIAFAWLELRAHGHDRLCGRVSAGVLRLYRRLGFVVRVLGPPAPSLGEDRIPIVFEPTHDAAKAATERHLA